MRRAVAVVAGSRNRQGPQCPAGSFVQAHSGGVLPRDTPLGAPKHPDVRPPVSSKRTRELPRTAGAMDAAQDRLVCRHLDSKEIITLYNRVVIIARQSL